VGFSLFDVTADGKPQFPYLYNCYFFETAAATLCHLEILLVRCICCRLVHFVHDLHYLLFLLRLRDESRTCPGHVYVLEMNVQLAESSALVSLKCTALCAPDGRGIHILRFVDTAAVFVTEPRRPSP
jgi:hypothetical protein